MRSALLSMKNAKKVPLGIRNSTTTLTRTISKHIHVHCPCMEHHINSVSNSIFTYFPSFGGVLKRECHHGHHTQTHMRSTRLSVRRVENVCVSSGLVCWYKGGCDV